MTPCVPVDTFGPSDESGNTFFKKKYVHLHWQTWFEFFFSWMHIFGGQDGICWFLHQISAPRHIWRTKSGPRCIWSQKIPPSFKKKNFNKTRVSINHEKVLPGTYSQQCRTQSWWTGESKPDQRKNRKNPGKPNEKVWLSPVGIFRVMEDTLQKSFFVNLTTTHLHPHSSSYQSSETPTSSSFLFHKIFGWDYFHFTLTRIYILVCVCVLYWCMYIRMSR